MVNRILLLVVFASLMLFLSGCLVTKQESECETPPAYKVGGKAICYNEVAVGYAAKGSPADAIRMCDQIADLDNWMSQAEQNSCYSEIAGILRDQGICERIQTTVAENPVAGITGIWDSYKSQCIENAAPRDYRLNACLGTGAAFVIPLLLFLHYRQTRQTRK